MTDAFMGEISIFAGTYAPKGWAFCNGQLLPINQNQALFSLLGTSYGGDGQKTFALPDLRSRVPVHAGTESGLPDVALGEKGGSIPNSDGTGSGYSAGPYLGVNFIIAIDGAYPARAD
jgi:microcystin-dependent protein